MSVALLQARVGSNWTLDGNRQKCAARLAAPNYMSTSLPARSQLARPFLLPLNEFDPNTTSSVPSSHQSHTLSACAISMYARLAKVWIALHVLCRSVPSTYITHPRLQELLLGALAERPCPTYCARTAYCARGRGRRVKVEHPLCTGLHCACCTAPASESARRAL
jgi:hypothetical protein